jgi:hypothetical protein
MRDYWTCSKFADWLRGTPKPGALTSKGWKEWKISAREAHPIRWWLAEEGLDKIQDVWCWVPDRINDVRYYINNRWVHTTHGMISHSLKKGQWHEFETRLLHSMFDQLVDFVEIEQAWHHVLWDEQARKKFETPWWQQRWFFRWGKVWRCPDAGIEYLIWASGLVVDEGMGCDKFNENYGKPTSQAQTAKELLELYRWWKIVRPARPDPYEVSGWSAYCASKRDNGEDLFDFEDKTKEQKKTSAKAHKILDKMERDYEKEDETMMIRLIKIRKGLWT